MLRQALTAVVERNVAVETGFTTEPYETAWAIEGRWFVHVLDAAQDTTIEVVAETSPEGLTWCRHEADPVRRQGAGLLTLALSNIGPWQRLAFKVSGASPRARVICYLTLKG